MVSRRLSEHSTFLVMEDPSTPRVDTIDIGGQTNDSARGAMKNYSRVFMYAELGVWNGSDNLDECRLEQHNAASSGTTKDLTTDGSGLNYDSDNSINANGDFVVLEARGEDFDVDNSFAWVSGTVVEAGNSGQDDCFASVQPYGYAYPQKELQGAAVTGEQVYVDTGT